MAKLDKSKPYGISCGDPSHAFVQDEKRFDAAGSEVGAKVAKPATTPIKKDEPKKTEADEQLAAQARA